MATWDSRGLRGSQFETVINQANEKYRELRLGLVQKIPTPIKPVEIDDNRHITLAYFEKKSTVDYIGVVQSFPICFDAKECASTSFALSNVHEHQFNFMADFEAQGGISFLLIHFTSVDKYYYMTFFELKKYYEGAQKGEKKSVSVDELRPEFFITEKLGVPLHYLEGVNLDIQERD
ncbi:MAG: Holliday junction resolvase RecU [Lachnospiraceae bacterium]|nr:Holliday junction resolvase RecU [Lachnospiraceae bacterium]MBR3359830.1 Holliday junction resolvase RecU [Lachnospiraceae bacterium]MBR6357955.1 Holliday junction resolvase RecU [Lachnospiraceae bacterium]MBR7076386.1 Holliday junction resolvase RecU [Lachnospiraceae bacterium]MDO4207460.1 Holliday junction resolvase RecU [Lachnospiraceae bacterium]